VDYFKNSARAPQAARGRNAAMATWNIALWKGSYAYRWHRCCKLILTETSEGLRFCAAFAQADAC